MPAKDRERCLNVVLGRDDGCTGMARWRLGCCDTVRVTIVVPQLGVATRPIAPMPSSDRLCAPITISLRFHVPAPYRITSRNPGWRTKNYMIGCIEAP